ncbi:protein-disulfide reductase DsbD domain-containing protein [Devosia sp.]|uniref:protein-disulfide reductase DsbD domain-containing protein n=1 Tax=Devosia sp. TaxID=1871048 RepID=UPI003BA87C73
MRLPIRSPLRYRGGMRTALALALVALSSPILAAETPWQNVSPGVRLRLIADNVRAPDGTTLIGLEVDMPADHKTYWRVPGETGIPTELDLAGSSGIGAHQMIWPFPTRDETGGYTDFVYYGPTVLPVRVSLSGDAADLKAAVVMGVCSDICLPVQATFELPLDFVRPSRGQGVRLAQAVALAPLAWDKSTPPVADVSFDPAARALNVQLTDPSIDPASLIAVGQGGAALFGAPQKSPDTNLVLLPLLGGDAGNSLVGMPVDFTFMTDRGAFTVTHQIAAAGSTPAPQ